MSNKVLENFPKFISQERHIRILIKSLKFGLVLQNFSKIMTNDLLDD